MFPEKFQQIYIRLYWKGSKSDGTENKQKIMDAFTKITGKKNNLFKFKYAFSIIYFVFLLKLKIFYNCILGSQYVYC